MDTQDTAAAEIIDLGAVSEGTAGAGGSEIDLFGLQPASPGLSGE